MKELKYRLVERENIFNKEQRFFPQVRTRRGLFPTWQKIAKHTGGGFGLYPEKNHNYPKTKKEAKQICTAFDEWRKVENNTIDVIHNIKI